MTTRGAVKRPATAGRIVASAPVAERTGDTAASVLANAGAFGYRWNGLRRGVRARCREPDPRDRPELRRTEPVAAVVPPVGAGCPVGACPARSDAVDLPLRQKTLPTLQRLFAICAACDRGHAYCTPRCRAAGRRRSLQAARAQHAISRVPRAVSTIATSNALTATPPPRDGSVFHHTAAIDQTPRP